MNEKENISLDELLASCPEGSLLESQDSDKDYIDDNIILLDTGSLSEVALNKDKFQDGVDEMSKLCGMITVLCNVGITPSMALSYISEMQAAEKIEEHNLKVSKINADANIEAAKYGSASMQKMIM